MLPRVRRAWETRRVFRGNLEKKGEKERVRAALLRAALRLGAVHGFASLGLREVAREAGIAPTSFYRHFADMQELGLALSQELVGGMIAEVCEAVSASRGPVAARAWDALFEAFARDAELMRFFVAERVGASAALRTSLHGVLTSLARVLDDATAAEALQPAAADAACLILLDGCARAVSEPDEGRTPLRESCLWTLGRLLGTSTEGPAQARPQKAKSRR
jgi:AcrR family transcriptional regulator